MLGFKTRTITLLLLGIASYQATAQTMADSSYHRSYAKINLLPLVVDLVKPEFFFLGIGYEHAIGNKKTTYGVEVDYSKWSESSFAPPTFVDAKHFRLAVSLPIRYYFRKQVFKGYYVGGLARFDHRDEAYLRGNQWGVGAIAGYQFLICKKYRLDLSGWIGGFYLTGQEFSENNVIVNINRGEVDGSINSYFGFPLGKKR